MTWCYKVTDAVLTNLGEPLFLLLALATVVSLLTAGIFAAAGRAGRAGRILRRIAIGAALYFAIVILVSIVTPRREYRVGDTQCFDDWCIAVADARLADTLAARRYDVTLRLSNRARRAPMGEKGTVVYVVDEDGRRYDPLPSSGDAPFDTILQPGQSIDTARRFDVSRDAHDLGLIYRHEGGFPIGWLIIGEGGWFQKPPIVRLVPPR